MCLRNEPAGRQLGQARLYFQCSYVRPLRVHLCHANACRAGRKNVALALKDADDSIKEHEYEEETYDQYGESYVRQRTFYSCGSSINYDHEEVLLTHKFMITQLTRRSAFLTMFGLFEHRMSQCLEFMLELTGFEGKLKGMGAIEKAHDMLKKVIGGKGITDLDHLTVIRNVMAHSDGTAKGYREISTRIGKKSPSEKGSCPPFEKLRGCRSTLLTTS